MARARAPARARRPNFVMLGALVAITTAAAAHTPRTFEARRSAKEGRLLQGNTQWPALNTTSRESLDDGNTHNAHSRGSQSSLRAALSIVVCRMSGATTGAVLATAAAGASAAFTSMRRALEGVRISSAAA